jgi:hypothetical protein
MHLDIKDMYPQFKFKAVKAAVRYYFLQLDPIQCERTKKCLEILKFSMGNMIVSFLDKYYKYGVDPDIRSRIMSLTTFDILLNCLGMFNLRIISTFFTLKSQVINLE